MLRRVPCALLLLAGLATAAAAHAQTADEIVAKNLAAKGGLEKWKAVTSLKMTGTMAIQGKELPLTIYSKRPNLMRHEMSLQEFRVVQAFDGTTAWAVNPMMGAATPQKLPAEAADMIRTSAEFDGALVDYKAKGYTAEVVGSEALGGTPVHHLKLTMKSGQVQHYYLDAKTGLEVRVTQEVDMGAGKKQVLATEMSNYRPVSGLMMPHSVKQLLDGQVIGEMTIAKVELNTVTDDSIFQMPKP